MYQARRWRVQLDDLAGQIRSALDAHAHALPVEALELEVTESLLMQDVAATVAVLRELGRGGETPTQPEWLRRAGAGLRPGAPPSCVR